MHAISMRFILEGRFNSFPIVSIEKRQKISNCQGSVEFDLKSTGALGRNRTCDQEIRRLLLYPLSYEGNAREVYQRPSSSKLDLKALLAIELNN